MGEEKRNIWLLQLGIVDRAIPTQSNPQNRIASPTIFNYYTGRRKGKGGEQSHAVGFALSESWGNISSPNQLEECPEKSTGITIVPLQKGAGGRPGCKSASPESKNIRLTGPRGPWSPFALFSPSPPTSTLLFIPLFPSFFITIYSSSPSCLPPRLNSTRTNIFSLLTHRPILRVPDLVRPEEGSGSL